MLLRALIQGAIKDARAAKPFRSTTIAFPIR